MIQKPIFRVVTEISSPGYVLKVKTRHMEYFIEPIQPLISLKEAKRFLSFVNKKIKIQAPEFRGELSVVEVAK